MGAKAKGSALSSTIAIQLARAGSTGTQQARSRAKPARASAASSAAATTKAPHSASASAWFRKVDDGETFQASSVGAAVAAMARTAGRNGGVDSER